MWSENIYVWYLSRRYCWRQPCNVFWTHHLVLEGYNKWTFNSQIFTVWSAPNCCYRLIIRYSPESSIVWSYFLIGLSVDVTAVWMWSWCGNAAEILELDENLNKEFHEFKKNLRKHMQLCLQVMDWFVWNSMTLWCRNRQELQPRNLHLIISLWLDCKNAEESLLLSHTFRAS